MSNIPTPASIDAAPEASRATLRNVEQLLGSAPNMFRLIATSPASIKGYVSLNSALMGGRLDAATRERIALAVAQVNDCDYCLAAHTYLGLNLAKLSEQEISANRSGYSLDSKAALAVRFAVSVVQTRGKVDAQEIEKLRSAGYEDQEIVEIVAHVALNTLTNYMNEVFDTEVDFPSAQATAA